MRDLTRLASRIVMFFMQFYYRLARHSRVSYKAYIDGRTRLAGYYHTGQCFVGRRPYRPGHLYLPREQFHRCRGRCVLFDRSECPYRQRTAPDPHLRIYSPGFFLSQRATGVFVCPGKAV